MDLNNKLSHKRLKKGRVVTKKIDFQLRFSLSWLPFVLCERPGTKFLCPIRCSVLNAGLNIIAFHLQDGGCGTWKGNLLNKCSKQDLFQLLYWLHVTDAQSSNLKTVRCFLLSDR